MEKILTITENAKTQMLYIFKQNTNAIGIKIGITKYGCSGKGYKFDLIHNENEKTKDFIEITEGRSLFIEPTSFMSLIGCLIDYKISDIGGEFVFTNPQAENLCGCGKSFK